MPWPEKYTSTTGGKILPSNLMTVASVALVLIAVTAFIIAVLNPMTVASLALVLIAVTALIIAFLEALAPVISNEFASGLNC